MDDRGKATEFQPGTSGNPNGRPPTKPITAALKDLLEKDDSRALKAIAAKAIQQAEDGDYRFVREILDRIEGKPLEPLDVTSGGQGISSLPGLSKEDLAILAEKHGGPE